MIGRTPPRTASPLPTVKQVRPKKPTARYVVEIRDAAGVSVLLTSVDWTASERDSAMSGVLKLIGFKPAAPPTRQGNKTRGGYPGAERKGPQKT